jgi:metal-responsive CopG/Arc/MetJ family transcriptional regulator
MRKEYTTVKVPTELTKRLDSAVKNLGYSSRADLVSDAIRHFIVSMRRETEAKSENQKPMIQS